MAQEKQSQDNTDMLEAVVENTEMGKNTLDQMIPMTQDSRFRAELLREKNEFHALNSEAHLCLSACGQQAKGQSAMAKLNTKMGIGMKTLADKSTRNLAQMLIEGSNQGVMDCIKCQRDCPQATPGAKRLMQRLQDMEQDNMARLEAFL